MNIDDLIGKVFITEDNEWYGSVRALSGALPAEIEIGEAIPFAEDEGGNLFLLKEESVCFWDHETNEVHELSASLIEFRSKCVEEPEIELQAGQVVSAWIDPNFAKAMGIEAPKDGWKKKP